MEFSHGSNYFDFELVFTLAASQCVWHLFATVMHLRLRLQVLASSNAIYRSLGPYKASVGLIRLAIWRLRPDTAHKALQG